MNQHYGNANRSITVLIAVGLVTVLAASSCSGKKEPSIKGALPVMPVTGTLKMDGEPMANATIIFHPVVPFPADASRIRPHAVTNEDGTFQMTTYRADDGAPAGEYRVSVSWKGPAEGLAGDDDPRPEKVPEKYRNPKRSVLKAEVKEAKTELPTWELGESTTQASINP